MNKNTGLMVGLIIILAIGGLIYSATRDTDSNPVPPGPTPPPPPSQTITPAKPLVTTHATTVLTDTTAVLTGSINPQGALTTYWYEYGLTSGNLNSKSSNQIPGSGFTTLNAPGYITSLTKNTIYYYRLVGENSLGRVVGAQFSFQTPQGLLPPEGSAPLVKTVAANGITRNSANLRGEVSSNEAPTQYWFEYGRAANLGSTTALVAVGDSATNLAVSISLADLAPSTTYYFRLNSQNQFGTVNGAILNFKTLASSPPPAGATPSVEATSATAVATTTATLRGSVDPNGLETKYWFEYSTDSLLGSLLLRSTSKASAGSGNSRVSVRADITGLASDTTYYFRVVAENSAGLVRSEKMTFRTK